MADKSLSPGVWSAFAKGKGYKDKELVAALEALARADRAGPPQVLQALDELVRPVEALRKAHKGDKALDKQLDELEQAAARARRDAEREQQAGEDDDSPAALTTKLVPLLRQVRKGEPMQALLGLAAKKVAVLLSRRAVGTGPQAMMKQYLEGGSVRFMRAQCVFEANAFTFVVEGAAAGLAKKIKLALLEQAGMRLKVRVRGQDPNDVDEDMEDGEDVPPEGGEGQEPSPQALEWQRRAAALEPRLLEALRNPQADGNRLRALWGFAQQKAEQGDHAAALKALDMLEPLLGGGGPQGSGEALETALAGWRQRRDEVVALLRQLAKEAAGYQLPDTDKALIEVNAVFKQLGGDLRTAQQVTEMETWLRDDAVVADVCELESRDLRGPLLAALQDVRRAIAADA